MLIPNQIIPMVWSTSNKDWYENKGYKFTGYRTQFEVHVEDLTKTSTSRIKVICDFCGRVYECSYGAYMIGRLKYPKDACMHCSGDKAQLVNADKRAKKRYDKAKQLCIDNGYTLLSTQQDFYNVRTDKITYRCPKHGVKTSTVDNFLRGHFCQECGYEKIGDRARKDINHVIKEISKVNGNKLLNPEDYCNASTSNLRVCCNVCGYEYTTSLGNYRRLIQGCPRCGIQILSNNKRLSPDEVELIINSKNNNILLNKYEYTKNNNVNLRIQCGCCGEIFTTSLVSYQDGKIMCDVCSAKISRGELSIKNILDFYRINYEREYWFDDCRDKLPLPFDFYLPNYNLVIEYSGIQHYEPVEYFGGEEQFQLQQKHDQIKRDYCKDNNIELLEIPYWEQNSIEQILIDKLGLHNPVKNCA